MLDLLKRFSILVLTILAPIKASIITVFCLVLFDLITGIMAAKRQGIPITSSGLKDSIIKVFVYECAIIFAFIIETYLAKGVPLTNIASTYIGLVELVSLNENLEAISGKHLLAGLIDKFKKKE